MDEHPGAEEALQLGLLERAIEQVIVRIKAGAGPVDMTEYIEGRHDDSTPAYYAGWVDGRIDERKRVLDLLRDLLPHA